MLNFIASLFGYLMNFIYGIVQNYGLAIIIFTVLVKIILLPFTIKQQRSLQKTQELQPLMQELQRKYANDQQKFMEEYNKLLKSKNMNMMSGMGCSGCVLSLIQIPIILGMFYMMASPLTHIMKLDTKVIEQYKEEVNQIRMNQAIEAIYASGDTYSSEELEEKIAAAKEATYVHLRYYEIDIIKEKGLMNLDFLGINLGDSAINNRGNLYMLIIPVLSTLFTYLSIIMTNLHNKKKGIVPTKPEDSDIPMPDMRVMNIMMPLMTGYIAYSVPQGVGLYWATSNFLNVIQMSVMRAVFDRKDAKNAEKSDTLSHVEYRVEKEKEDEQGSQESKEQKDSQESHESKESKDSKNSQDSQNFQNNVIVEKPRNQGNKKKSKNKKKK